MWVLSSTDSMHSALLFSMKPMPPMSAARLNTLPMSCAAGSHASSRQVGDDALGPFVELIPLASGLQSTARTVAPASARPATRWPPMNPPAPVTSMGLSVFTLILG